MQKSKAKFEIRYYKGRFKVQIVMRSKNGNYFVEALEEITLPSWLYKHTRIAPGDFFVTVPRLLWKKCIDHKKEWDCGKKTTCKECCGMC